MIKKLLLFIIPFMGILAGTSHLKNETSEGSWNSTTPLSVVLEGLGENAPGHKPDKVDPDLVQKGYEIVHTGKTTGPNGKKTKRQSKYYLCTNCHNTVQEDPDLRVSDPEARLQYALEKGIPFLQATTFHGIVTRESWYNDDYFLKYGDLVKPARDNLREAIQLCSIACSQGRYMEEWEIDAVVAYYYSIELTLGDLNLSEADLNAVMTAQKDGKKDPELVKRLKTYYLQASPATFHYPPQDVKAGYGMKGDAEKGRMIWNQSCLACHDQEGPSNYLTLDNGSVTLKTFKRNLDNYNNFSIYQITRYGTEPIIGHKAYMPHYTAERMSDQQVEDLRAYIETGGKSQ